MVPSVITAYAKDLGERVFFTFVEGTIGSFAVTQATSQHMWIAAAGGGIAAVASLLKGLAGGFVGNPSNASLVK